MVRFLCALTLLLSATAKRIKVQDRIQTEKAEKAKGGVQPFWGCGLLGPIPGINEDGSVSAATQTLIDGLKATNKYDGKVSYWNWDYAPKDNDADAGGSHQYLTKDFLFMPENWGVGAADEKYLRTAGVKNFPDGSGKNCPATMADIFLGANEPDIYGSCMGNMMGKCTGPCQDGESDCPVALLSGKQGSGQPNAQGHCNCWEKSHATGVGFWPVDGVDVYQPLPTCWSNPQCIESIMGSFKKSAATAHSKGYKYLSAPLVAVNMDWMKSFVEKACSGCSDISCGCPTHVGWHFYANDCRPASGGGYDDFQKKLDATVELMEQFPHLQGAVVNEVGMLNCAMDTPDAICIPGGPDQQYPALSQPNHACPATPELPKGLGTFIEELLARVSKAKTSDGRRAVVSFTWFNLDMSGGTYNLQIFDEAGNLNQVGESYLSACKAWADGTPAPAPAPVPVPTPAPVPTPSTSPASTWNQCSATSKACCNPYASATQYCTGGVACQACGGGSACECPEAVAPEPSPQPTPAPAPTPAPTPSGGSTWQACGPGSAACCNPYTNPVQVCGSGATCQECGGSSACECP